MNSKFYRFKISYGLLCFTKTLRYVFMKKVISQKISNLVKLLTTTLTYLVIRQHKQNALMLTTIRFLFCLTT